MRALIASVIFVALAASLGGCRRNDMAIHFEAPGDDPLIFGIHAGDGLLVCQFTRDERVEKTPGVIVWDGLDDTGQPVKPGTYTWTAVTRRHFNVQVSGVACINEPSERLPHSPMPNPWGGKGGRPMAVAADETCVYLGWSGGQVVACNLDGRIKWSVPLPNGASCQALAVDGDSLVALARNLPPFLAGDHLVKLSAADGAVQAWPGGTTLPVTSLWPENADTKPALATAMAARTGHIYLTFSELRFLAVLRTDTGAYLQTVVGPPPGHIDVTPTKTEAPGEPGKLIDADFAVVALQGGTLGKVLLAHEPLWVMMSDLQPLDRDERITALALLGDGAKHHKHSIFVGLGAPFHQVQRRSVLASEGFLWIAGRAGGRTAEGPWEADALGPVQAVALDARGRLWVAEGDAVPPRFSVWNTEGKQGRLEREFFGPMRAEDTGAAVLPTDPEIVVGGGCEWRIDPSGGPARCLGIITRDRMSAAGFRTTAAGVLLLHVWHPDGRFSVFERRGEGDYVPREQHVADGEAAFTPVSRLQFGEITLDIEDGGTGMWFIGTSDGLDLGIAMQGLGLILADRSAPNAHGVSSIARSVDGKIYAASANGGLFRVEIGGMDSVRRLPGGKLTVRAGAKPPAEPKTSP